MIKKMKKPGVWILLILIAALIMVSLYRLEQLAAIQNPPEQPQAPLAVFGVEAVHGPVSRWICGEGTVASLTRQHLFFQAAGKVVFLGSGKDGRPLQEGSRVSGPGKGGEKGTYLAGIDNRAVKEEIRLIQARQDEAEQELEMARTTLDQARKNLCLARNRYDRSKKLYDLKVTRLSVLEEDEAAWLNALTDIKTSQARIKGIMAGIKGLGARYEQALIQLENTALYAPFDGVVARLNISEGDYFDPARIDHASGDSLLAAAPVTIIDPGKVEVTLNLPVFDGIKVVPGQRCTIEPGGMDRHNGSGRKALPSQDQDKCNSAITARVYSVSPVLSANSRTIRVRIRAEEEKNVLFHGMFVTCRIETEKKFNALLIPMSSLLFRNGQAYVYVDDQGKARKQDIVIGVFDRDRVEVLEGVLAGERIITKGRYRLFPGRPVRVLEMEKGSER